MADSGAWTPETARQWALVFGVLVAESVGGFMLIWQTCFAPGADPLLIGAALLALGVPPSLGIDSKLRSRAEDAEGRG